MNHNDYGLLQRDIKYILDAIRKHLQIEQVIIFGSRAMGNYKKASDVDIAVKGKNIDKRIILKLSDDLNEEYPLPYYFDIVNYNEITNKDLKQHIDNEGKVIYTVDR